ncbi:MAG: hypothetical protein WCK42_02890 [Myxococcaceae bacterium]
MLLIYVGIKKTSSVPLEPSVEVPMSITAKQFHRDYQANEARADEKYKGKLLTVTGNVASIDKDLWGNSIIQLSTGDMFDDVRIKLASRNESWAASLNKGELVTINCRGGIMVIGSPGCDQE